MFQEELAARIPEQHAALLDKKEVEEMSAVKGPSRPEPEPPHAEVNQPFTHICSCPSFFVKLKDVSLSRC